MTNGIQKTLDFTKDWYSYLDLPSEMLSRSFAAFAASNALANEVIPEAFSKVNVLVEDSPTGYTNGRNVVLPMWYFAPSSFSQWADSSDSRYLSLACLNGTLIHEMLHVLHSIPQGSDKIDIEQSLKSSYRAYAHYLNNTALVVKVFNIVEDIYIESTTEGTALRTLLQGKNTILLSSENLDQLAQKDVLDIFDVVNVLVSMKNIDNRNHVILVEFPELEEVLEILLAADVNGQSELTIKERSEIVADIMDYLVANFDSTMEKDEDQGNSEGDSDSDNSEEGETSEDSEEGETSEEDDSQGQGEGVKADWNEYEPIEGKQGQQEFDKAGYAEIEAARQVARNFANAVTQANFDEIETVVVSLEEAINSGEVREADYYEATGLRGKSDMTKLARALKFRDTTSRISPPTKSGPRIHANRLSRHKFDNRLFGHRTRVQKTEPEIIILIDGSGSMGGPGSFEISLWERSLAVAKSLHETLGTIPHLILTDTNRDDKGYIVKIQGSRMDYVSQRKDPFSAVLGLHKNLTPGGVTLKKAGRMFSQRNTNKLLIVISDGQPDCRQFNEEYVYENAVTYTKEKVEELRREGVNVLSISITTQAQMANDLIYGKDMNMGIQARNLDVEIQRIIGNLVKTF